jgi:hypothetical protein
MYCKPFTVVGNSRLVVEVVGNTVDLVVGEEDSIVLEVEGYHNIVGFEQGKT